MDIEKEIEALIVEIENIDDPVFIKAIKGMLVYHKKATQPEWWNGLSEEKKQKLIYG